MPALRMGWVAAGRNAAKRSGQKNSAIALIEKSSFFSLGRPLNFRIGLIESTARLAASAIVPADMAMAAMLAP